MNARDKNTGSLIDLILLAIEAAREVYQEQAFQRWAASWADGSDRSFGSAAAIANELVGVVHGLAAEVFEPASEALHGSSAKPPVAHSAFEEAMKLEETEGRDLARKTYAAKAAAGSAGAAAMLAIGNELPARMQAQSAIAAAELAQSA